MVIQFCLLFSDYNFSFHPISVIYLHIVELKMIGHRNINSGPTLQLKTVINELKSN